MKTVDILTVAQKEVLRMFAMEEDLAQTYTLSGGTALAAFHLFHRRSDDLDFFSMDPVDALRVRRFAENVREKLGTGDMEVNRLYDRHLFLIKMKAGDPLKIEFTQYPYPALEEPLLKDGIRVESLRDVGTDKLAAMLDRFEPKDYYDLYCLLSNNHATLPVLRKDLQKKFHIVADSVTIGAAFARAQRLPILPHMLMTVRKEDVQELFENLSKNLKSEVIE